MFRRKPSPAQPFELPAYSRELYKTGINGIIDEERQRFFSNALLFLRSNGLWGNYLEFGVFQARTFRQVMLTAESYGMQGMMFYALDSFEGFPMLTKDDYSAKWGHDDAAGTRAMSEADFLALVRRDAAHMMGQVRTVKGFYDKTLTPEMADRILDECRALNATKLDKATLITVDCDLYESAVPVFNFLDRVIDQGTVVYIDDYWVGYRGSPKEGVAKAFNEYRTRSTFDFADWGRIGGWGHAFVAQHR